MNEFTKEDLENLHYCMRQMTIHINKYDDIYNKLQSMIDNYCDHEFLQKESVDCERYGCDITYTICSKCGVKEE